HSALPGQELAGAGLVVPRLPPPDRAEAPARQSRATGGVPPALADPCVDSGRRRGRDRRARILAYPMGEPGTGPPLAPLPGEPGLLPAAPPRPPRTSMIPDEQAADARFAEWMRLNLRRAA